MTAGPCVSLPKTESIIHCERSHNLGGPRRSLTGMVAPGTAGRVNGHCDLIAIERPCPDARHDR